MNWQQQETIKKAGDIHREQQKSNNQQTENENEMEKLAEKHKHRYTIHNY